MKPLNTPMLNFPIVDPHIHQWDPYSTPHRAALLVKLLGKYPKAMDKVARKVMPKSLVDMLGLSDYALAPYLPQDYATDVCATDSFDHQLDHRFDKQFNHQAGYQVDQIVHVEAGWHDHNGAGVVGETRWIKQLPFAQQGIQLGGIVATADFKHAQFAEILALQQAESPLLKGLRRMASHHPDAGIYRWSDEPHLYRNPKFLKGFEIFAKTNLSFDAWVYSNQLQDVIQLAKAFPQTPLVLDHLGTPIGLFGQVGRYTGVTETARATIFAAWKDDISQLAEQTNSYAKISGLMMPILGHTFYQRRQLASAEQMVNLLSPLIKHAIQAFGIHRIIYASNFPMDKVNTSLTNLMDAYVQMISPYGDAALQAIFKDNATAFYRLGI